MKKYALQIWCTNITPARLITLIPKKYISKEEFIRDDWQEKAYDLDYDDYIEY